MIIQTLLVLRSVKVLSLLRYNNIKSIIVRINIDYNTTTKYCFKNQYGLKTIIKSISLRINKYYNTTTTYYYSE